MCTCASCEYTDSFAGKGFAEWPRGEPAGPRASDRAYAAHVAHAWSGAYRRVPFTPGQPAIAPRLPGLVGPVQHNATAIRWNSTRGKPYTGPNASFGKIAKPVPPLLAYARQLREERRAMKRLKIAA